MKGQHPDFTVDPAILVHRTASETEKFTTR